MLGQRQVVGVVGRRQTEGVGQDKRLIVQPGRVVEFDGEGEECGEMLCGPQRAEIPSWARMRWRKMLVTSSGKQWRRNDRLLCLHGRS